MTDSERLEIDELDRRILSILCEDSRVSSRKIAQRCKVSVGTVLSRIKRMEQAGIIKGYTTLLDHERLGYQLTAIAEITVSKGKLLEMEQAISKHPNVCAVYDITGLTDALVIAKFRTREELSKFTKGMLAMPFIERTNTHIVLTTMKEDLRLL
jgi:DNA-binding Lrp family transcriptional regulator